MPVNYCLYESLKYGCFSEFFVTKSYNSGVLLFKPVHLLWVYVQNKTAIS